MKKRRASARRFHCPSWARTRTLLIQRWHRNPLNSCNLQLHPRDSAVRCRVSEGQMQFWVAKRPSHCWSACCILAAGDTKLCPPTAAACSSERGRPHWEECDEAQASEGLRLCTAAGNADGPQGGALPLCLGWRCRGEAKRFPVGARCHSTEPHLRPHRGVDRRGRRGHDPAPHRIQHAGVRFPVRERRSEEHTSEL